MSTAVAEGKAWGGGNQPLKASYGKMMMWFFIVHDVCSYYVVCNHGISR